MERSKYYSRDEWNVITFTKKQKKVFTTIPFYEMFTLGNVNLDKFHISMDAVVLSSARVMPTCMAIGEAAGVGASVAVDRQIEPAKVDSSEVAKILRENGAILSY